MDADQFKEFMKQFQILIQGVVPVQQRSEATSVVYNFEPYDKSKENFLQYLERFDNYLQLKGLQANEAASKTILLNSIGPENYELLKISAAPREVSNLNYKEVIDMLKNQLITKSSVIVERHRFLSRKQNLGELVSSYANELKKFIPKCQFACECGKSVADVFLISQFIRGLNDQAMRQQLLLQSPVTFDEAIMKALALEASISDNKEISGEMVSDSSIHRVSRRFRSPSAPRFRQRSNSQQRNAAKQGINFNAYGQRLCFRCGRNNHTAKHCRVNFNQLKCNNCKKKGHVEKVCLRKEVSCKKDVNSVDKEEEKSSSSETYDILQIIDIYAKQTLNQDSQKYFASVKIEDKIQIFEVDSGAGHTLLPKTNFDNLQLKAPIQATNIRFRSYTSGIIEPLGFVEVPVRYKNITSNEILFVVPDGFAPLMGRTWIRHLNIRLEDLDNKNYSPQNDVIACVNPSNYLQNIYSKFKSIFEQRIGRIPSIQCSLQLKENQYV